MDFLREVGIFSVRQKAIVTLWVTCVYLQITYHFIASQFSTLCPNSSWLADYRIIAVAIMGRMAEPDRSCDGVTFNVTDGLLNHPAALLLFIYCSHPQSAKSEANLLDYSCAVRHLASFDRLARTPATAGLSNFRKSTRAARARRCARVSNTQAEQKWQRPARIAP